MDHRSEMNIFFNDCPNSTGQYYSLNSCIKQRLGDKEFENNFFLSDKQ